MHSLNPLVCFNSGEWSPTMDSRIDLPNYRKACRKIRNVIPTKQGGGVRRPGTVYIGAGFIKGGTPTTSRLEKFQFAPGQTFILEFCDLGVRFYSNGSQIMATGVQPWATGTNYVNGAFVTSAGFTYYLFNGPLLSSTVPGSDSAHWRQQTTYEAPLPYSGTNFTAPNYWTADVHVLKAKQINDVVYIVHPNFPVWKLTRFGTANWVSQQVAFLTPAMLDQNTTDITIAPQAATGNAVGLNVAANAWVTATYYQPGNSVTFSTVIYTCITAHTSTASFLTDLANGLWKVAIIFQTGQGNSYWQIAYNRPSSFVNYNLTGNGTSTTLPLIGGWTITTYGTWSADISLQASYDNGTTWQVVTTLSSRADANFDIDGQDISGGIYRMVITNWTSETSTTPPRVQLTADNQFVYGLVQITSIVGPYNALCNVIVPLYTSGPTTFWSEGAWSDLRGYPQAITIFQERMWYGASSFQPQRVWATQTDDLENFAEVDESQAEYGMAFDLNAPGRGPIQWMNAQTDLFCGLAGAEWVITSGQPAVAITPQAVIALEHSVNGSCPHLPGVIIGNACFYVQRKGTSFQQMLFSVFTNKYMSTDMQVLAQHLTSAGVRQFDFQQQFQNQSILWAVCGDGSLISLTYSMDQEVFGWAKHVTGDQVIVAGSATGGVVILGQTYTILTVGNTDFTLFGAPNNNVGTTFVATGNGKGTGTLYTLNDFGFLSVQVIYGADGQDDEVWVTVQRTGLSYATVERLNPTDWQTSALGLPDLTKAVYADSAAVFTSPATNSFTGLPPALPNRSGVCASITPASGIGTWVVQNLTVPSNGILVLPNYVPSVGDIVVIGFAINWAVQPMRLDVDLRAGPTAGLTKSIRKLYIRTVNSMGGNWATKQGDVIALPWVPINQNPNNPPPFTATIPIELGVDVGSLFEYENDPQFSIIGNDPLPFTLLGIVVASDITEAGS